MTGYGKVYEKIEGKNKDEVCKGCWFLLNEDCTLHDHPTEESDYCGAFLPTEKLWEQNQSLMTTEEKIEEEERKRIQEESDAESHHLDNYKGLEPY